MTYRGTGYGKLLLFGEHAAVYGYPAVGLALTDATTVAITPQRAQQWDTTRVPRAYRTQVDNLLRALDQALPDFCRGVTTLGGRVEIGSSIPPAQGYGSSASLCVASAAAALTAAGEDAALPQRVWSLANRLERLFHGRPSGVDTGLALQPGVSAFHFDGAELPRLTALSGGGFYLVAGSVPRTGSTRELIAAIGRRMLQNDRQTAALLAELGELASEAIAVIPGATGFDGIRRLGGLVNRAQRALEQLELNTPQLARCLAIAGECGALGGKLSGAGGGGAFYALFGEEQSAVRAARELVGRRATDGATVRVLAVRDGRGHAIDPSIPPTARDS